MRFALLSINRAVAAHSPRDAHVQPLAQLLIRNRSFPLHFARDCQFPPIRPLGIRGIGLRFLQSIERLGQVKLPTLFVVLLELFVFQRATPLGCFNSPATTFLVTTPDARFASHSAKINCSKNRSIFYFCVLTPFSTPVS
jgi:hypothetical protein